jgi:hypothetical protein
VPIPKRKIPLILTSETETVIANFTTEMQFLGSELNATDVR